MQIGIQARGFELSDGLRAHTLQRLNYALGWARYRLRRIVVSLADENGPRGGDDKRCSLRVELEKGPTVQIEDTQSDLYVAIGRAAERASRTVARRIQRQRKFRSEETVTAETD